MIVAFVYRKKWISVFVSIRSVFQNTVTYRHIRSYFYERYYDTIFASLCVSSPTNIVVHTYMYARTYAHTHTHKHKYTHAYVHIYICKHIYIYPHMHPYTWRNICTRTRVETGLSHILSKSTRSHPNP